MATPAETVPGLRLHALFETFLETKTASDVDGTMAHFAPDMAAYIDATSGWDLDSYAALKAVLGKYMPTWAPPARSYASKVLAGENSALVHMVDTPELFGSERRVLAAVDFVDGKIVRWVDYWDSTSYDTELFDRLRTPAESFPTDLKDTQVATRAAGELVGAATALQRAFASADPSAAAAAMYTDVVLVDMALRTQVIGQIETTRYLERVLRRAPYGRDSTLRHIVGGRRGGGFEWTAAADRLPGITALELDPAGLITTITSVYDSRQLDPTAKDSLHAAAIAAGRSR